MLFPGTVPQPPKVAGTVGTDGLEKKGLDRGASPDPASSTDVSQSKVALGGWVRKGRDERQECILLEKRPKEEPKTVRAETL